MSRVALADPPPLTPAVLSNFPFRLRAFPFFDLRDNAALTPALATHDRPAPPAEDTRVE